MPMITGLPDLPSGVLLNGTEEVAIDVETSPGVFTTYKTTTGAIADLGGGSSGGGGGGGLDQLTGDVTAGPGTGAQVATIPNSTVTFAKMQDVTAVRLLGRGVGANGAIQEISLNSNISMTGTALDSSAPPISGHAVLANTTGSLAVPVSTTYAQLFGDFPYQSGAVPGGAHVPMLVSGAVVMMDASNFPASGGSAAWGGITGTLSAQTDLDTALNGKVDVTGDTMTGNLSIQPTFSDGFITTVGSSFPTATGAVFQDSGVTLQSRVQLSLSTGGVVSDDVAGDLVAYTNNHTIRLANSNATTVRIDNSTSGSGQAGLTNLLGDIVSAADFGNFKITGDQGTVMLRGGTGTSSIDMCGFAQLSGGTVTVTCDGYSASGGDPIILAKHISASTPADNGVLYFANNVNGQFDIVSTNASDDGLVFWAVLKVNSA